MPDTFAVGDSTLLTVTARNPGAEPVEFTAGDCGPLDVEIRLASGATILPGLVGCTAGGVTVVPAGREIAASVVWRGERGSPGPVVPGAYAVRGVVRTANGGLYGAPTPVWIVAP